MRSIAALLVVAAGSSAALAQPLIRVFGQNYTVSRVDYSAEILLPNIPFPQDPPVPFIESEGLVWAGNNRLLLSADDISDAGPGMPDNWIVEATLRIEGGVVTGFSSWRRILAQDPAVAGFDINPTGIGLNSGAGLAGGGNIVAMNGDGLLYGFSYQPASLGQQLEWPVGSGCSPANCAMNFSSRNTNAEDVTFVPARGGEFFVINQDIEGVERWNSSTGEFIASFPIGAGIAGSTAKGLAYLPDSPALPASIRRPGGVVLVSFDDNFPALQAFDVDGNLLATERLTVDGTSFGAARLDIAGCPAPLTLESLTGDAATGRLFLSNQGSLTLCNYLFVLEPIACPADYNADGVVDFNDFLAFLNFYNAGDFNADVNGDLTVDFNDLLEFLNLYNTPC